MGWRGKLDLRERHLAAEKGIRNLNKDSCSVTGLGLTAARASMREVPEQPQAVVDDFSARPPINAGDEAQSA
jgi:hypothetical protein